MESLLTLVESIDKFAQFKNVAQRSSIAKIVLSRFSDTFVESIREQKGCINTQQIWDSAFLKTICADWGDALSESVALLNEAVRQSYQVTKFLIAKVCSCLFVC